MTRGKPATRTQDPAFLEACDARVAWLHRYWQGRRGDRVAPCRADIEPADFRLLLPCILLVDVTPAPRDFVYRVVGTEEVRRRGRDPTGRSVSTHYYGPDREDALGCYRQVCETRSPLFDPRPYRTEQGGYSAEETLFLPLSEDGETVSQVLVYACRRD